MATVERRGPLSTSQEFPWLKSSQGGPLYYQISPERTAPVPVAEMVADISTVLRRHEALRTRFGFDEQAVPFQEVLDLSSIDPFLVRDETVFEDWDIMAAVTRRLAETSTVIVLKSTHGSVGTAQLYFHKAAVDGISLEIIWSELTEVFAVRDEGREALLPEADWHPIDQALHEGRQVSTAGRSRSEDFWSGRIAAEESTTVPFHWNPTGEEDDVLTTSMEDNRLLQQCGSLAQQFGLTVHTVLTTALLIVTSAWTEKSRAVITTPFSGRIGDRLPGSVGHYSVDVNLHLELVAAQTFPKLAGKVRGNIIGSFQKSGLSVLEIMAMRSRRSAEHRVLIDNSVHLNLLSYRMIPDTQEGPAHRSFRQEQHSGGFPYPFMTIRPTSSGCTVSLGASPRLLRAAESIRFLEHFCQVIESVLRLPTISVKDVVTMMDLERPWHRSGWHRRGTCWINLDRLRDVLENHSSICEAKVFLIESQVVARLVVKDDALDADGVRGYVRRKASWDCEIPVPDKLVLRLGAPAASAGISDRTDTDEKSQESGPAATNRLPTSDHEALVARAFRMFHPELRLDLDATYAQLGGDFRKIPGIIRYLAENGVGGLHWRDLAGISSLRDLATGFTDSGLEAALGDRRCRQIGQLHRCLG